MSRIERSCSEPGCSTLVLNNNVPANVAPLSDCRLLGWRNIGYIPGVWLHKRGMWAVPKPGMNGTGVESLGMGMDERHRRGQV